MIERWVGEILERMVQPNDPSLSAEVSRHFLSFKFTESERQRIDELSAKARNGTLSTEEESELDFYLLISHLIAILQSKARVSLKAKTSAA
jgi:hypothetical protein